MIGSKIYGYFRATVSAAEVRNFNASWPCSELQANGPKFFEFAPNGDLVEHNLAAAEDGSAASAMAEDCKAWLFENKIPDWRIS